MLILKGQQLSSTKERINQKTEHFLIRIFEKYALERDFCDPILLKAMKHSTVALSSRQLHQPGKHYMTETFDC